MYYLALETFYRQEYNLLKQKYKEGKIDAFNVYDMESPAEKIEIFFQIRSKSVWPFYGLLFLIARAIGYYMATQTNCLGAQISSFLLTKKGSPPKLPSPI